MSGDFPRTLAGFATAFALTSSPTGSPTPSALSSPFSPAPPLSPCLSTWLWFGYVSLPPASRGVFHRAETAAYDERIWGRAHPSAVWVLANRHGLGVVYKLAFTRQRIPMHQLFHYVDRTSLGNLRRPAGVPFRECVGLVRVRLDDAYHNP